MQGRSGLGGLIQLSGWRRACFGLMGFIQDITLRLDGDLTKPYGEEPMIVG